VSGRALGLDRLLDSEGRKSPDLACKDRNCQIGKSTGVLIVKFYWEAFWSLQLEHPPVAARAVSTLVSTTPSSFYLPPDLQFGAYFSLTATVNFWPQNTESAS
jgi:hypothetical protein